MVSQIYTTYTPPHNGGLDGKRTDFRLFARENQTKLMSQTQANQETVEEYAQFIQSYYREDLAELAQTDARSLEVSHSDLYRYDKDIGDDVLSHPDQIIEYLEEGMQSVELPSDETFDNTHARMKLDAEEYEYYPSGFSPSHHHGKYRAIKGEVSKATDVYSRMIQAAFECQRCGTLTRILQQDGEFQEPHECTGCERQGPFQINYTQSEFVDGQKLRIKTPPERAQGGDGQSIDGFVEDDLTDLASVGDRVTVSGIVELEQQTENRNATNKFEPYLDIHHIEIEQTDAEDVDISIEQKERIKALAAGEEGGPLDLAAQSLAPKIYGYDTAKKAIILALVGGSRTEYAGGDFDRGEFHVLLIGDPSTGKSKLVQRAEKVGWRSVGISGKGSTVAGVTASAVQDDFAGNTWTLESGAFVKANKGVVTIDELDDMPKEVRAAALEPMSKQTINVTKGGINATLETRTAVVAAANPEHGRFDPYEPIAEQFAFGGTLLSRFDLVFTFKDDNEEEKDREIADHILNARDAAKRQEANIDTETSTHEPDVQPELLRAWIALAKRQPKPVFATDAIKEEIRDSFLSLRGLNNREEGEPIPVTHRKLEGMVRIAEAAAKIEFSEEITERHISIAQELVGSSMQDIGKDEDGNYDADVVETGTSKNQRDRVSTICEIIQELQNEYEDGDGAPIELIQDRAEEQGISESKFHSEITNLKSKGAVYEPIKGQTMKFVGRH